MSIRKKIFFGLLISSITTVAIIVLANFYISYQQMIRSEITSSDQQLTLISKQIDFFLTSVNNFSRAIVVDKNVQELTLKYNLESEKFNQIDSNNFKNAVNNIIQSTEFIHSVSIYSIDRSLIATTQIYGSPSIKNLEDIIGNPWVNRDKISMKSPVEVVSALSLIKKFYSYDSGAFLGYIEIAIPQSAFMEVYRTNETKTTTMIVGSAGQIQSSTNYNEKNQLYPDYHKIRQTYGKENRNYLVEVNRHIFFFAYVEKLDWFIIKEVDYVWFFQPIYTTIITSSVIAFVGIVLLIFVSHFISKTITKPISQLTLHLHAASKGNWKTVEEDFTDKDIHFFVTAFNNMIHSLDEVTDKLKEEQQQKQSIHLHLLQQQVNPHFLYNTLDNICSLAEIDEKEKLILLVMNLSKFYRETLSNGNIFVTIGQELSIVESYLQILSIRYYQKFVYSIVCQEEIKHYKCLKLLLQPIVENSITHGVIHNFIKGKIEIQIYKKGQKIYFVVTDNGVGITEVKLAKLWDQEKDSFGIKNLDQRIKLHYGEAYGVTIENVENGCKVVLEIGIDEK